MRINLPSNPENEHCNSYEDWINTHVESLNWIIGMAHMGIAATPDAGNHPDNPVLYMLECDVKKTLQELP